LKRNKEKEMKTEGRRQEGKRIDESNTEDKIKENNFH
jgi:hypothetical protein